MDRLKQWLLEKLKEPIDYYNQHTFDYSRGYRKCILDILEYMRLLRR